MKASDQIVRVGFCGVGGTGKTTTVGLLRDLGLPYLASPARKIIAAAGLTEKSFSTMTPEEMVRLQKLIFDAKLRQEVEAESFITDRTLLDQVCYGLLRGREAWSESTLKMQEALLKENMQQYVALFYFPMEAFRKADDDFRDTSYAMVLAFDAMLRGFLGKLKLDYWSVPPGTAEERADFVREKLLFVREMCMKEVGL